MHKTTKEVALQFSQRVTIEIGKEILGEFGDITIEWEKSNTLWAAIQETNIALDKSKTYCDFVFKYHTNLLALLGVTNKTAGYIIRLQWEGLYFIPYRVKVITNKRCVVNCTKSET